MSTAALPLRSCAVTVETSVGEPAVMDAGAPAAMPMGRHSRAVDGLTFPRHGGYGGEGGAPTVVDMNLLPPPRDRGDVAAPQL